MDLLCKNSSQPVILKLYYNWRAILFADCTIKTNKLIILKTLLIWSQNATEEVKTIIDRTD